mgnify:CR=1 FL=1
MNHSTSGFRGRVLRDSASFFVRDSGLGVGIRASGFVRVCRAESPALPPEEFGFWPDFGAALRFFFGKNAQLFAFIHCNHCISVYN